MQGANPAGERTALCGVRPPDEWFTGPGGLTTSMPADAAKCPFCSLHWALREQQHTIDHLRAEVKLLKQRLPIENARSEPFAWNLGVEGQHGGYPAGRLVLEKMVARYGKDSEGLVPFARILLEVMDRLEGRDPAKPFVPVAVAHGLPSPIDPTDCHICGAEAGTPCDRRVHEEEEGD